MKYLILFLLCLGAAAQERIELKLPDEVEAKCQLEGGCLLITNKMFNALLEKAAQEAYQYGFDQGAAQVCTRKDI